MANMHITGDLTVDGGGVLNGSKIVTLADYSITNKGRVHNSNRDSFVMKFPNGLIIESIWCRISANKVELVDYPEKLGSTFIGAAINWDQSTINNLDNVSAHTFTLNNCEVSNGDSGTLEVNIILFGY